jgi:hypothetical protein
MAHRHVDELIQIVLIDEFKALVYTHEFHYLSFVLICNGIEFLGACLDDKQEFTKQGRSGKRFRNAIKELFPEKYDSLNQKKEDFDLYNIMRNALTHTLIPSSRIGLTHRAEASKENVEHLSLSENGHQITLICEDFYNDFEKACNEVIRRVHKKEFKHRKMYIPCMIIPDGLNT